MIILTDKHTLPALPKKIGDMPVSVRRIGDYSAAETDTFVVCAELDRPGTVRHLNHLFRQRKRPERLVFVVDKKSHHECTQANSLGATDLLQGPVTASALLDLCRESSFADEVDRRTQASILKAADALDQTFASLSNQGELDEENIRESSIEIVDAISERGLSRWMTNVRECHEGTFQHCLLVTGIATAFGHHVGMSQQDIGILTTAGLLHDIGKITIPVEILDKTSALTLAEMDIVRTHPVVGHDYLVNQGGVSDDILSVVRSHHEYLDGSGYPDGISSGAINNITRVLTVCDIYGALAEDRPYKPPVRSEEAISHLFALAADGKVEYAFVVVLADIVGVSRRSLSQYIT